MRHGKKFNHLGRQQGHRRALLKNLAIALIEHKRINTTLAKAKALRVYVEPLITKSKLNTTHSRRVVFSYLQNKEAVKELFDNISTKVASRPGGYVRIIKTGFRQGDAAEMAMIELVDYNDVLLNTPKTASEGNTKKKRRTRRSKGSGTAAAATAAAAGSAVAATEAVVEETTEEVVGQATETVVEETTVVNEVAETVVEETTVVNETTETVVEEEVKEEIEKKKGSDPEWDNA